MNSAFTLWVLSTIIVGYFSWRYTRSEAEHHAKMAKEEMIQKLDIEISNRLESALLINRSIPIVSEQKVSPDTLHKLLLPPSPEKVLIPEFANRGIRSLTYELSSLIGENSERGLVDLALQEFSDIEDGYMNKPLSPDQAQDLFRKLNAIYNFRWDPTNIRIRQLRRLIEQRQG